ncbi:ATP-dependent DNA ligase [Phenylobacterium sp.]|uniref:ATP-dependent DNA ligase n=1 Tax=Phenylobacterium sp. TaxID=1871053 RepID=UPI002F40B12C
MTQPQDPFAQLGVPLDLEPMEAKSVGELPGGPGWRYEPKWDGFRCLAFRAGQAVELKAKSGKPLTRYFPEMAEALRGPAVDRFVLDAELTVAVDGRLSFDALQMRLHPAQSRIDKLSRETPAELVVFDRLADARGGSLLAAPLRERRAALEAFAAEVGPSPFLRLSPGVEDAATAGRWLDEAGGATDGVVAKRLDEPYRPGERAMLKIKRLRTADCVVGGFRYASGKRLVGSLLLGLYDAGGRLDHVGFTSTISNAERPELTRELEAHAGPPGFTGRAPGGPSRWSDERTAEWTPLRPELVVEVRYDHVTGDRFRHGTKLLRWRPDKAPGSCTLDQLHGVAVA